MAAKLFIFFALIAAVAYAADDCNCDFQTDEERSQLWEFFKKLADDREELNDEPLDFVLPGELSPLLDCSCSKKTETRKKRKILPEVSEVPHEMDYSDESIQGLRTPKCPHGYVWFGIMCVEEKFIQDKK